VNCESDDPTLEAARAWATPVDLDRLAKALAELNEAELEAMLDVLTGSSPEREGPEAER
jgi:hypothetical protein